VIARIHPRGVHAGSLLKYLFLCRCRHKNSYADITVMPSEQQNALVGVVVGSITSA
jgi:hypothetical protein